MMDNQGNGSRWIRCPVCGSKTRTKVYDDTVLIKFPLYCPKCKKERKRQKLPISYIFCFMGVFTMRFIIDTNLERIIVPDSFFNQIDKMNQVLVENGAAEKKIDYVKYIEDAIEKAKKNAPVRKSDVKSLK